MTHTISSFTNALQKANKWLEELKEIGEFQSEEQAYIVLRSVLHALRERLLPDEAVQFGAEMPMLIRGFYFEGYDLSHPKPKRDNESFFNRIAQEMQKVSMKIPPKTAAQAVLILLENKISTGEFNDVVQSLPKKLRKIIIDDISGD